MNKYFLDKVNTIRSGIADLPNLLLGPAKIMQNKNCHVDFDTVPVSKVNRILKSMKNSKSTSIDQLDNFCIKVAADIIDSPLHHVICLSIAKQKFPSKWKLSKVIPLHKKQCVLDKKNYRPVSLLSPLSKVLEKIIYEQLYGHFDRNKIFHEGQVCGAVFLDLSAAFDLIDPKLLLKKLEM